MPELLRPDVYVEEVASPPGVPLVPVSTGGFIGVADRGPVDEAILIDSFTAYVRRFGGYRTDSYLTYGVKGFFDNGGSRCYVVRTTNSDASAVAADSDLTDFGGDATAFNIATRDVGAFGNFIKYNTTKFETTLTNAIPVTALPPGATTAVLGDVSEIQRGDILYFDDGTDTLTAIAQSINLSTKTVTFATPVAVAAEIGAGARVATPSQHRVTTQTTVAIPASAVTSMTVLNASAVRVGQVLTVSDGTTLIAVVVTGVNGNEIVFASVTPTGIIPSGSLVVSQEFILRITDTGTSLTPHEYLATQSTNKQDYVENRLFDEDSNESLIIEMEETSASTTWQAIPLPVVDTSLTGGLDGTAPGDSDYVGTEANGKGMHALDKVTDINFLGVPGITTTTVQQGGLDYAGLEKRRDIIFLVDPPSTQDLPTEVRDWRLNTLNRDTSFGALYYPWIQINDPEADGQVLDLPPSGHVMGVYSAVARTSGPHTPPANIAISGINGVAYEVSDGDHDILNPIGVNVIRGYPGEGIRIMGARTLQNAQDGKHYVNVRNLTNFIKKSLVGVLRQYLMQAIDPSLWSKITNTCTGFMQSIWRSGWLYPSDDQDAAYSVKCDRENNPQEVVDQGRVNVAVGYNPPFPAEFIVLRLFREGGNVEVSE